MMEDKEGTMTTAITNPKKITLEDLEEKLESFIQVFNDDLCRTIIEYMIDSEGPFAITRYKKFGSPWFYQATRDRNSYTYHDIHIVSKCTVYNIRSTS